MGDNQLELEVQLKLELENDFDDAIFKKIEAAAQKASKNINKMFGSRTLYANMTTSLRSVLNIFKQLDKAAKDYLNTIKEVNKELQKQAKILGGESTEIDTSNIEEVKDKAKETSEEVKKAFNFKDIFSELGKLGKSLNNLFNFEKAKTGIMLLVSAFKSLTTAIEKNIKLTVKLTSTVIASFGKMVGALTEFTVKLSGLPLILRGINTAFSGISSKIQSAFSRIDFTSLAKEAVELSSSLTEVKNVIDVVFGDSAKQIYEFTSNAITQLGMTTLAAQQYTGKFAAAMRSTGQSIGSITDMSKALTQLTSDIASFYDIEQDIAAEKIFSGVISGMVKPMRTLGVDMTNASLNAWMLSRGLNATYESLSAVEKQTVRYEYVMEKLNYVHGDYQRTINSTANQLRLLKNQLKELGSVIGTIINAFFNPFVQMLNRVVAAITNVVKAIAAAMGIDWTLGTGSGVAGLSGVADSYDDVASSADDLADAEDGVAKSTDKAAKAAKKALAPFHKLNVLQNKNTEDASKSSGKGAGSGIGDLIGGITDSAAQKLPSLKDMIQGFLDWLWNLDWEGAFGKFLDALDKWFKDAPEKVQGFFDKLQPWIVRIAGLFNMLIEALKGDLGYNIGATIGEVLEGIARSINTFFDNISGKDVGQAIANIANGLTDNEDLFKEAFRVIGNAIQTGFEMIQGFSEEYHWKTLGENLYKGLKAGFEEIDPQTIHDAIFSALKGVTDTLNTFFENFNKDEELKKKIGDCLAAIIEAGAEYLKSEDFSKLVDNIAEFLSWALEKLADELDKQENREAIGKAIDKVIEGAGKVLKSAEKLAKVVWKYVSDALVKFFKSKDIPLWLKLVTGGKLLDITGVKDAISTALKTLLGGKILLDITKGTGGATKGIGGLSKVLEGLGKACSAAAPYIAAIGALLVEFFAGEAGIQKLLGYDIDTSTFATTWTSFWSNFAEITQNAWNNTVELFTTIIPGVFQGLGTVIGTALGAVGSTVSQWFSDLHQWFSEGLSNFASAIDGFFAPVREAFNNAFLFMVGVTATVWEGIQNVWSGVASWFDTTVWEPLKTAVNEVWTSITGFFNQIWTDIQSVWSTVKTWFDTTVWEPLKGAVNQLWIDIKGYFDGLWTDIQTTWSVVSQWFIDTVWTPLTAAANQLWTDIKTYFDNLWTDIKTTWETVSGWFEENVWKPIKDKVDEVKKKIKEGFGDAADYVKEKWDGFVSWFGGVYDKIKGWLDDLISKAKEFAQAMIDKGSSVLSGSTSSVPGYASGGVFYPNRPQLAILGDNKSQMEYALTTGHLKQIADMMSNVIGSSGFEGNITIPIYVDGVLSAKKVITASQMHNYRSNGR